MRTHAGQVAFPGGRIDPGEDAVAAAFAKPMRSSTSTRRKSQVIGPLDPYRTVTGFRVTPVIAVVPPDLPLSPHDLEVADWFEAPLAFLLDPANQRAEGGSFRRRRAPLLGDRMAGRRIWGATAAMLVNLSRRLQWT